jgi:hypothetical protein
MKVQHAVIAAAVVAAWSVTPAFGQTAAGDGARPVATIDPPASHTADERASAVIRIIDAPAPPAQALPVTTAELVQARAAGEMAAPERSDPIQVERIHIDDPAGAARPGPANTVIQSTADGRLQIVRAGEVASERPRPQTVLRLDDAARYRETARYEAERKRRVSAQATASEPARPRTAETPVTVMGSAQGRAEISWSAPEPTPPPAVVVIEPEPVGNSG